MSRVSTHTVPNSVSVQLVAPATGHVFHCAMVRRDRVLLAMYPARWPNGLPGLAVIPSVREVQADARPQVAA